MPFKTRKRSIDNTFHKNRIEEETQFKKTNTRNNQWECYHKIITAALSKGIRIHFFFKAEQQPNKIGILDKFGQ